MSVSNRGPRICLVKIKLYMKATKHGLCAPATSESLMPYPHIELTLCSIWGSTAPALERIFCVSLGKQLRCSSRCDFSLQLLLFCHRAPSRCGFNFVLLLYQILFAVSPWLHPVTAFTAALPWLLTTGFFLFNFLFCLWWLNGVDVWAPRPPLLY